MYAVLHQISAVEATATLLVRSNPVNLDPLLGVVVPTASRGAL